MNDFLQVLESVLKQDARLLAEDKTILKHKANDLAMRMDPVLLKQLYANEITRQHFFVEVEGLFIFDKVKFSWVLSSKEFLPSSYTRYANKIGLLNKNGENVKLSTDVTMVWPFKDCILEGGQTKEDQKREEIFYNETLAPDEVNRLLYPKVFTNAKKYTAQGVSQATEIANDDNLIVKGNNLLALSSLLKRYEGEVKLINIDPPYNTGNDSFGYNDRFSHSTWLTFMKNRISMAYKLLDKKGFLCCQVNESESYYLKVLLDEIFGRDNYLSTLFVKVRYAEKTLKQDMDFHKEIEQILVYRKSPDAVPNFDKVETGYDKYVYYVKETGEHETIEMGGKRVDIFKAGSYEIVEDEPTKDGLKEIWASGTILDGNSSGRFFRDYLTGRSETDGLGTMYKVYGIGDDQFDYRYFTGPKRAGATKGKYYQGVPMDQLNGTVLVDVPINSFYDLSGNFGNCRHEGGVELRSGKKPEILYSILMKHFSNAKDLVVDFFLGSGTTCAVAHKMGRQYIGIEQLNYEDNDSVVRLQNVINGDRTGVSELVQWQGGGSFVYCELKELTEKYMTKIQLAKNDEELGAVWKEMKATGFISHYVRVSDIDSTAKDLMDLSFEDRKRLFATLVDKNMLYVNLCDIDDAEFGVSAEDKAFNNSFYGRE